MAQRAGLQIQDVLAVSVEPHCGSQLLRQASQAFPFPSTLAHVKRIRRQECPGKAAALQVIITTLEAVSTPSSHPAAEQAEASGRRAPQQGGAELVAGAAAEEQEQPCASEALKSCVPEEVCSPA